MASTPFALDLSRAPNDVVVALLSNMDLQQRLTCALVCSEWARAAAAATHSIVWKVSTVRASTQLQQWLGNYGSQIKTLQLRGWCDRTMAKLPCTQLQDLLLHGDENSWDLQLAQRV